MKPTYRLLTAITLLVLTSAASAHCHEAKYYVGAGIGLNSENTNDSTGFQFMGGYCLDFNFHSPKTKTAFEVGYMNSGDFSQQAGGGKRNRNTQIDNSYRGVWMSGLAEYKLETKLDILGRVGIDLGDANGMLFGTGVGYDFSKWAQVRAEYIVRNAVDSVQLNWVSEF